MFHIFDENINYTKYEIYIFPFEAFLEQNHQQHVCKYLAYQIR